MDAAEAAALAETCTVFDRARVKCAKVGVMGMLDGRLWFAAAAASKASTAERVAGDEDDDNDDDDVEEVGVWMSIDKDDDAELTSKVNPFEPDVAEVEVEVDDEADEEDAEDDDEDDDVDTDDVDVNTECVGFIGVRAASVGIANASIKLRCCCHAKRSDSSS